MLLNMVSGFIAVMNRSRMNEVSLVLKSVSVLISSLKEAQKSSAKGEAKTVKPLINVLAVMDVTCSMDLYIMLFCQSVIGVSVIEYRTNQKAKIKYMYMSCHVHV